MEKILKRIAIDQETGCWNYVGSLDEKGYALANRNGRTIRVHRYSYEHHNGPIPEGLLVCHKCDNRRCINPEHLFLGTAKDNCQDMLEKGRRRTDYRCGMNHGMAKLTDEQVAEIRKLWSERRLSQGKIAKLFNASRGNVTSIVNNRTRIKPTIPKI